MRSLGPVQRKYSFTVLFTFLALLTALLVISATFKLVTVIEQSVFDGKHQFNLVAYDKKDTHRLEVLSFAPDRSAISILSVTGNIEYPIGKKLKVPIDGFVKTDESFGKPIEDKSEHVTSLLMRSALRLHLVPTSLTVVDFIRLLLFARSVERPNIRIAEQILPADELEIDKTCVSLFGDSLINQEKMSIQIINGTNTVGLGNRLARLISNIGGNVVSVISSDSEIKTSEIAYIGKNSYTVQRLSRILKYKVVRIDKTDISDIIIKIGKDSSDTSIF